MAQALRSGWGKSKTKLRAVILLKNITNGNANLTRELVTACNVTEEDYEKFGQDLEIENVILFGLTHHGPSTAKLELLPSFFR